MNQEEWKKHLKVLKTKRNLHTRQNRLIKLVHRGRDRFRQNKKAQLELRRVVSLCFRLGEKLHNELQEEFVEGVMES